MNHKVEFNSEEARLISLALNSLAQSAFNVSLITELEGAGQVSKLKEELRTLAERFSWHALRSS